MTSEDTIPSGEKAQGRINLEEAGPDIELQGNGPWTIWAWINAADDHGIQISGVKDGDMLELELISGIGYFAGASGWWRALSIAIEVGATVITPTNLAGKIAAKGLDGVNKVVPKDEKASKPRDGYGEKLDGAGVAHEEGGLVICPPITGGPKYAVERPSGGGAGQHGCFFPTRAKRKVSIKDDGVLSVVAFDSNYTDNAGRYEVRFKITRKPAA